jgi:PAS domain S-box-containing protein
MKAPERRVAATPASNRARRRPSLGSRPGYALAVALPTIVTLVVWWADNPGYRLGTAFIASVAVLAAVAGTGPAVLGTAVGLLGFWYTVAPPQSSFALDWPEGPVALLTFVVCCGAVVAVGHQRDEEARRTVAFQRRYRRLSDIGLFGVIFWQIDGPVTGANDAFLSMIGYSREDLDEGRIDWKALTPPEYHPLDAEKLGELAADGYHEPYEKEYLRKDGSRVAVLVGTAFLEGSEEEGISFILDITERWRLEHEREAILASERRALRDAEAATRRLQVVAAASALLMAQLDPDEVVRQLAEVVVPELADMASVWVPLDGELLRAITVHATHTQLAEVLTNRYPVVARPDSQVAECFRKGRTLPVTDLSVRGTLLVDHDAEYEQAVKALQLTEGVVVPLKVGREVLGALTLSGTVDRGPLEPGAVLAAEQIAERAAVALQKAQSFAEEREIATLMQRALLPDSQRSVEGHEVATCYVPAAVGREIGGDWWDVLRLPDGRVGLIVGDVSGHGVHVAPSMAKLRHSIDGVLMHGATPAEAVTAASRLLEVNRPGSYATAFVSVYDPRTRELVYSRAGHPPPLLVLDDGVVPLDHPGGTLLGLNTAERSETTTTLPEVFELVAFTDGLVEEPGLAYDDGVERLVRAVRALPRELSGQPRAERLVTDIIGTTGRDDVCVVMVRPELTAQG